jgi:hypothetical protein
MPSDFEIAKRYFDAMAARDYKRAGALLAPDAEIITPDGAVSGSDFLESMRNWSGLDNLDISVRDRVLSEEDGLVVSRAIRVFSWKESGEVAYEQPAEMKMIVTGETITYLDLG